MASVLAERVNVDVIVYSRVNRVLMDGDKAIGVEVFGIGDHKIRNILARKEVILSAGVIDSPKILMLSGIGDCAELKALNIECVSDVRGVGKAFQDHTFNSVWGPPLLNQSAVIPAQPFDNFGVLAIDDDGEFYNSLTVGVNLVDFARLAIGSFAESFHYDVWTAERGDIAGMGCAERCGDIGMGPTDGVDGFPSRGHSQNGRFV